MELQREYLKAVEAVLELEAEALAAQKQLEVLTGITFVTKQDSKP